MSGRPVAVSGGVGDLEDPEPKVKKQARDVIWTRDVTQCTLPRNDVIKFIEMLSHNRNQNCRSELCSKRPLKDKFFLAASRCSVSILHMWMFHDLCFSTAITKFSLRGDVSSPPPQFPSSFGRVTNIHWIAENTGSQHDALIVTSSG